MKWPIKAKQQRGYLMGIRYFCNWTITQLIAGLDSDAMLLWPNALIGSPIRSFRFCYHTLIGIHPACYDLKRIDRDRVSLSMACSVISVNEGV